MNKTQALHHFSPRWMYF